MRTGNYTTSLSRGHRGLELLVGVPSHIAELTNSEHKKRHRPIDDRDNNDERPAHEC